MTHLHLQEGWLGCCGTKAQVLTGLVLLLSSVSFNNIRKDTSCGNGFTISWFRPWLGPCADVLMGGIPDSIESRSNQIQGLLEDPLSCLWLPGMVWAMNIWMPSRFSFACLVFCHGCMFLPKKIPWDIGMRHSPWDWKDHHQKPAGRDHFVLSSTGSILNLTEPIDPRVLGWWTHDLMVAPQVDLMIAHPIFAQVFGSRPFQIHRWFF